MRAVVQRVTRSKVEVEDQLIGQIDKGLMVLLGVSQDDKMNLSLVDVGGQLLVVSQFTLFGDCRKGRRPGFSEAARPDMADDFYQKFVDKAKAMGVDTHTGKFRSHMMVELVNDGPVTLLIDSKKNF